MNIYQSFVLLFLLVTSCTHHEKGEVLFTDSIQSRTTDIYDLDVTFPLFKCASTESCQSDDINALIDQRVKPYLEKFEGEELAKKEKFIEDQKDFTEERKFTLNIHHETLQTSRFVSAVFSVEVYELGAHGNQLFETLVFDYKKNRELTFQDLIEGDLEVLNTLLTDALNLKDGCFDRDVLIEKNFEDFSLSETEMFFHFAPYELGAYVCGPVSLSLSIERLKAHKLWAY